MLGYARQQRSAGAYVVGDIERLPLATGSIDIVFSNLAVQWCDDLPRALAELYRVLRPGGILALSTLAQGSLEELAHAPYRHRLQAEPHRLHYPHLTNLLREIKGVGAGYLHNGRTPGLTSRSRLQALEACWPHRPAGACR